MSDFFVRIVAVGVRGTTLARRCLLGFAVGLTLLGAWGCALRSAPAAQAESAPAARPSPRALLRSMTDYLATRGSFSFRTESTFEIFDHEQKLQFSGAADIQVRRPDRLAIDYRDDLSAKQVWYDGSELTLFDHQAGVFASMSAPPKLEDALDEFERRYGVVLPLTDLIGADAYTLIASRVRSASYVGLHKVEGEACHHLAFVGDSADLQLWIHQGDRPAPCKLVIDYKHEPGRPQFAVIMMDWEFDHRIPDSNFTKSIPDGARKIEFLEMEETRR